MGTFGKKIIALLVSILITGPVTAGPVMAAQQAQDQGTIIVTAEKREENVRDIPAGITVISDTRIEDSGISRTIDIVSMTPNLFITETGNGMWTSFASMRGVASAMTGNSTVGVYVDDVYYPNLDMSLYDVERIEVLRGPQGTLYGRNAEAGIINVITRKPSSRWEAVFGLDAAGFDTRDLNGAVSGPLATDRLNFKTAFRYHETDGHFNNQYNGSDDTGREENADARLTLSATPTEKLDLTLTADLQAYNSPKYAHFAAYDTEENLGERVNVNFDGESHNRANGASLRAEWQLQDMRLVSVTSGRKDDNYLKYDSDFSPLDLMTFAIDKDLSAWSQELRLVSDRTGSPVQWLGGMFLLSEEDGRKYDNYMDFMNMGMGMPGETLTLTSTTETLGTALFGQMTYGFSNGADLTLGLRYDRERKEFDYGQTPSGPVLGAMGFTAGSGSAKESFDAWLPKAAFSYRVSEAVTTYASVARGFRSGGFNDVQEQGTQFKPEYSWNYELGVKTAWLDNRLQLNAALFYIDRTDMLVEVMTDDGSGVYIDNAAEAHAKGVEIELYARPVAGLELSAGAGYTHAEYDRYTQGTQIFDGNRIIDSPEFTLNVNATYRFENGVFLNTGYRRFGEVCFDNANRRTQSGYGILDTRIGYEWENFDLYFYADNLLDEAYVTRAFDSGGTWYARAGAPQTFGGMFRIRF